MWRPVDSCTCLFVAGSSKCGSACVPQCHTVECLGCKSTIVCQGDLYLLFFLALGMIKRSSYSLWSLQEYTDVCQDQKERKQSLPLPNSSKVLGKWVRAELLVQQFSENAISSIQVTSDFYLIRTNIERFYVPKFFLRVLIWLLLFSLQFL